MRSIFYIFVLLTTLIGITPFSMSSAQNIPGISLPISMSISPETPGPLEEVVATIILPTASVSEAEFVWIIDGKTELEGIGKYTHTFQAGELGSEKSVVALVRIFGGEPIAVRAVVRPVELTISWEALTYTPPLYNARALYSPDALIKIEATAKAKVTDEKTNEVKKYGTNDFYYSWRRNGMAISNSSGRGKSLLITEGPKFAGADVYSVKITSADGKFNATKAVQIKTIDPIVLLYYWNPLFGIFGNALGEKNSIENTGSISAQPFYFSARNSDDADLNYEWRVNGRKIKTDPNRQSYLSLGAEKSASAVVSLSVEHETKLLQSASVSRDLTGEGNVFGNFNK